MILADCFLLARYISIFWLKNPMALPNDFWCLFINSWVLGFSWITQFVIDVMLGNPSHHVHICMGTDPHMNTKGSTTTSLSLNNIVTVVTFGTFVAVYLRIQAFNLKSNNAQENSSYNLVAKLENSVLPDMTASLVGAFMFVLIALSHIQLNLKDFSELNRYPNYLYEYFYRMVRLPLIFNLFFLVLIARNNVLKTAVARKFEAYYATHN
jgi:hypothetical protein